MLYLSWGLNRKPVLDFEKLVPVLDFEKLVLDFEKLVPVSSLAMEGGGLEISLAITQKREKNMDTPPPETKSSVPMPGAIPLKHLVAQCLSEDDIKKCQLPDIPDGNGTTKKGLTKNPNRDTKK